MSFDLRYPLTPKDPPPLTCPRLISFFSIRYSQHGIREENPAQKLVG